MQRYSKLWWASILLSSVVVGSSSFAMLTLLTDWSTGVVLAVSAAFILAGDLVLALMMQAVSPTRVTVGPGERWHKDEMPAKIDTVRCRCVARRGGLARRRAALSAWIVARSSAWSGVSG